MAYKNLIKNNIFPIPVGDKLGYQAETIYLLYAPLAEEYTLVDHECVENLKKVADNNGGDAPSDIIELYNRLNVVSNEKLKKSIITHPDNYTKMSIMPTARCNFACNYCYSAHGRSAATIPNEVIKNALDYFLRPRSRHCKYTLFISGGGEPMLVFDKLQNIVTYAQTLTNTNGDQLDIMVISNGSLIREEHAKFFKQHQVCVCVSFEITESLQNMHRGHYDVVRNNIFKLLTAGVIPSINATITPQSVSQMSEMIEEVAAEFPGIKEVMFEPVTPVAGFSSNQEMELFYDKFIEGFRDAKAKAGQLNINLNTSILDNLNRLALRHCQGKLCLTPQGTFSICHTVTSPLEKKYDSYCYGEVKKNGVFFDIDKFLQLQKINVNAFPRCKDCFAKWHCGGGCMSKVAAYNEAQMNIYCRYYRKHLLFLLLEKLNENMIAATGESLSSFIQKQMRNKVKKDEN